MNSPPTLVGLGAEGLGFALAFPDNLNCQACNPPLGQAALEVPSSASLLRSSVRSTFPDGF
ncbi:hypothetical protein [Nostoc sp.]|uniref:hypothetical protein n=1 Tax=Nostoc sp. TaxID=1180 RepID=UPI002FF791F1